MSVVGEEEHTKEEIDLVTALDLGWHLMRLRMGARFEFTVLGIYENLDRIEGILEEHNFRSKIVGDISLEKKWLVDYYSDSEFPPDGEIDWYTTEQYYENHYPELVEYTEEPDEVDPEELEIGSDIIEKIENEADNPVKPEGYYERLLPKTVSWYRILSLELHELFRVSIYDSGVLDMEEAMQNPSVMFSSYVWDELAEGTKSDISEAVQSLAHQLPTASVMLSLRALERQLHFWFEDVTEREPQELTFGQVLTEIDNEFEKDDRPAILSHLDYLKDRRNQVAHPQRHPSVREAESTIIMVRETISEIIESN